MDLGIAGSAPIVIVANGQTLSFAKPKRRLLAELYAAWVEQDRQALKVAMVDAELGPDERKVKLMAFASDCRQAGYPILCLSQYGRAQETLAKAGVGEAEIELLDEADAQRVALRMWGFQVDAEEGDAPGPKAESPSTGSP